VDHRPEVFESMAIAMGGSEREGSKTTAVARNAERGIDA